MELRMKQSNKGITRLQRQFYLILPGSGGLNIIMRYKT
jgi:hypothetical protein